MITKHKGSSGGDLAKRLRAYSAAAAATAAVAGSADAAEVVWDIDDVVVGDEPGRLFNLVTGATALALSDEGNATPGSMRLIGNYAANANYPGAYIYAPASSVMGAFVGIGSNASLLSSGVEIDGGLTFGAFSGYPSIGNYANLNNWTPDGTRGFVGIRFQLEGVTHYGWADITYDGAANAATLHAFGYNDTPGAATVPPAAPELAITELDYDPDEYTVTLTWRKTGAASYVAHFSLDMIDWGSDMGDGLTAAQDERPEDSEHITVTFSLADFVPPDVSELFFRIREE